MITGTSAWAGFIDAWWEQHRDNHVTVYDLVELAKAHLAGEKYKTRGKFCDSWRFLPTRLDKALRGATKQLFCGKEVLYCRYADGGAAYRLTNSTASDNETNHHQLQELEAFVTLWQQRFGESEVTTKELLPLAVGTVTALNDAKSEQARKNRLSRMISYNRNREVNGYKILVADCRHTPTSAVNVKVFKLAK